jgi:hypothetical protein
VGITAITESHEVPTDFLKAKVLLEVFLDWQGIVHYSFIPKGAMVNKERYK